MAIGSGSAIGEAYIRIRPTATGFQAEVVKEVTPAMKAAEKNLSLKPKLDEKGVTGPLGLIQSKLQAFAGKSPLAPLIGDVQGMGGALSSFAAGPLALVGAGIAAFALKGAADFTKVTAEVRAFQRVVGTTAEDSSRFVSTFKEIGIAPDQATTAMGRFTKSLGTNADALAAQGIAIARNKDGTIDVKETFLNLADAVSKSTDTTAKNALVIAAFGRGGLALLPILNKGREGIADLFGEAEKHGLLFSQEDLQRGADLSIAMRQLKEAVTGAFIEGGKVIVPFLTDLAHVATGIADLSHTIPHFGLILKAAFLVALPEVAIVVEGIHIISSLLDKITGKHRDAAGAASDNAAATAALSQETIDAAAAVQVLLDKEAAHKAQLDTITSAVTGVISAQQDQRDATTKVSDATAALGDKQRDLAALLAKGAVDAKAVAAAHRDLDDATRGVADATRDAAAAAVARTDAERVLADLLSGRTQNEEAAKHTHDLEHAQLGVRSSTLALSQAQTRLLTAQGDATSSAQDLADAQLAVDEATLALTESQEGLAGTQDQLNTLSQIGAENSVETIAARQTLDEKTQGLAKSQQALADAIANEAAARVKLTDAEVGDLTFTDKVVQARKDVKKAEEDLAAGRQTLSEKSAALLEAQAKEQTALEGSRDAAAELLKHYKEIETQAPETKAALDPLIALLTGQLQEVIGWKPLAPGIAGPPTPIVGTHGDAASQVLAWLALAPIRALSGPGVSPQAGPPTPITRAAGGPASGSFWTGERGPELVTLAPGGGSAMVTPAHRLGADGGGVHLTVEMVNHWGPGTSYDDVMRAMTDVANGAIAETLQRVVAKAGAR